MNSAKSHSSVSSSSAAWRARLQALGASNIGGLVFLTLASWWIYQALGEGFFSSFNLFTLSQVVAQTTIIGFAQLVAIVIGRLNLAVAAIAVSVVMFSGALIGIAGVHPIVGMAAGVMLGAAIGAFTGWLELKTKLQSFIVTLAMHSALVGAVLIISGGASVTALPQSITRLGGAMLFVPELSVLVIPTVIIAALLWYLYFRSSLGWKMLAVGANQRAAQLSAVPVPYVVVVSFALSGALAGAAGLMEMSRVAAALPSLGAGWLLASFIVPILGGTALAGGSVSIGGAVLAAVFIASINSGLVSLNVEAYWQQFAQALALLLAVLIDQARRSGWRRASPFTVRAADPEKKADAHAGP